ncbi:UpxY family transcription antiterminator [Flammeovirga aprica]|uniref:UpxY family transcription antiterminator n=1 Tax=Flammeovirga aprica JL-4 TaxID=694437 RepID=A0A7X9P1E9_9BACT|nr:UpxY family transcription antiterminator [Flammeovirga aprica]NME67779.1 UpxY family transcription antiterminator [Flammeovirga aprica JL-4]
MTIKETRQWMVIYTKPKSEKKVAERLNKKGFSTYCPTFTTLRQWSDRKKKVTVPVIPSYVFIQLNELERWEVLKDPGILNFIFWQGKPAIIQESQLNAFKSFIENTSDPENIKIEDLNIGDRVLIQNGAFQEQSGLIQSVQKNKLELILPELNLKVICAPNQIRIQEKVVD